ncbi:polysaccharide biosynthesis protein [Prevotella sp. DNF00663]|uniref:oligosaccharide flippase family protein n=1 Tax=Prevotella sp. DNF00663 TaxID=1384078 RepID=UPI0007988E53|nr:oligosaccharide flippase family protein [Prevotella sp. DNF00663]KXB79925.1 polysaccharide biosynthesis protein [Prevotella sp. DNF00663]
MNRLSEIKKKINSNKDGKTVFANFGYLSLLQIAGYVFPLITMPYLARVIGADGVGKIAFASAIVVWIQTISDWGFNLIATRDVAQNRADKEKVSRIFSNVLWARCLLTLFSGLLLLIAVLAVPYLRENADIIFVTFLLVPGYILFPEWFFQAIERMKYTTIFNLLIKLIFTISVFIFIHEREDYLIQPLLTTIGYLLCGIGALYLILMKWGYTLYSPQWGELTRTIKGSTDVFINNLMPNLYNSFSVMLLGFFGGATANGLYDGGNKFPTIFYNFQSVLSRAFYPFLSRRLDKHSFYAKLNIGLALIGSIFLIAISPFVIKVMLGDEFEKSVIVMQILSFSVIFLAMDYTYGTNFLILNHKEKPLRNLTFVSSILGMSVSIPLVYYFSYIGAAITVLLCRGVLGVGTYILAKIYCQG